MGLAKQSTLGNSISNMILEQMHLFLRTLNIHVTLITPILDEDNPCSGVLLAWTFKTFSTNMLKRWYGPISICT